MIEWLYTAADYFTFWHGLVLGLGLGVCLAAYAELAGNARSRRR